MVPKLSIQAISRAGSFRAVLFRMVPKPRPWSELHTLGFRAVLFRMVPKRTHGLDRLCLSFRAVLFRMVPKQRAWSFLMTARFRAVLFRMVPKLVIKDISSLRVF